LYISENCLFSLSLLSNTILLQIATLCVNMYETTAFKIIAVLPIIASLISAKNMKITIVIIYTTSFKTICIVPKNKDDTFSMSDVSLV